MVSQLGLRPHLSGARARLAGLLKGGDAGERPHATRASILGAAGLRAMDAPGTSAAQQRLADAARLPLLDEGCLQVRAVPSVAALPICL
jgi:hypothetical protein